jgi:hydrogenase maturation protease
MSVHEVGLSDLMDMARLSDTLPRRRALVGIQPEILDWGERPSPAVEPAVREAAQLVLDLARRWRADAHL